MAITKFFDSDDEEGSDLGEYKDDIDRPKWYDQISDEPFEFEESSEHTILSHKIEAQRILEEEIRNHQNQLAKAPKSSELGWIYTVLQKGASGDKMAAMIMSIQNSPICNLNFIKSLTGFVKPSKKKQCLQAIDNLVELYLEDLLPQGRKLRPFGRHPFSILTSLGSGRRARLAAWLFESQLKEAFADFISALEVVSKDTVEANRQKVVSANYKLLSGHPEMEDILLQHLVNKLGDPSQKVVSRVIYSLTQLLRVHPNMKQIVMDQVEKIIFRPNIGARVQYYAICFLSQYIFCDGDVEVARAVIKIYFSFFKASIKKDEIDSRMMGALLMGVKRAYPYAKLDANSLSDHISTLYKLVHVSPFTISLHALCLLEQVSSQSEDRFYCALYKKLLDPKLISTTHQAMFINCMFKALSKDDNSYRVAAIIKRLLQVCLHLPVPFLCGVLYMVSQITNKKANVRLFTSKAHEVSKLDEFDSDDEEEVYVDADKVDSKVKVPKKSKDVKPSGWSFVPTKSVGKSRHSTYSWEARNPLYCKAETTAYFELLKLNSHFHPTVSLFAQKILNNELIVYTGDPLSDFTLLRFLERFVFKNPKTSLKEDGSNKGPDPRLAPRKYYKPSGIKAINVSTNAYFKQDPGGVPVDETFLFRYLKDRAEMMATLKSKPAGEEKEEDEDGSDVESVASDEFDEMLSRMMGAKNIEKGIDFEAEIGNQLKKRDKKSKSKKDESEEESEEDESEEEEEEEEDADDDDDFNKEDDELLEGEEPAEADMTDSEGSVFEDSDSEPAAAKRSNSKKKFKGMDDMFAPAEEFAELLEEAGTAKSGMAHTFSNPDNAAVKQLNWEAERDRWIRGGDRRKRKFRKQKPFAKKKFKK